MEDYEKVIDLWKNGLITWEKAEENLKKLGLRVEIFKDKGTLQIALYKITGDNQ